MLMLGSQITQSGDILTKISPEALYQMISTPQQAAQDLFRQLNSISMVNKAGYAALKKKLPYFVCSQFHPANRRKENFSAAEYFVIDLDHVVMSGRNLEVLRNSLKGMAEVMLCFKSPSGEGLKILFKLSSICKDSALFSSFYKVFAVKLAERLGIADIIDYKTNDVTRACFLSHDPDAYFNPCPLPIDLKDYFPELDFETAEQQIKDVELVIKEQQNLEQVYSGPDAEMLKVIRERLNPSLNRSQKNYFVPGQIEKAVPIIKTTLETYSMSLVENAPISFGNKLKIRAGNLWAEINIFYGKKGFSVVKTTKTGSNWELADLAAATTRMILNQMRID